jgi:glycerol uptake facilitator-like aquaporin
MPSDKDASKSSCGETSKRSKQPTQPEHSVTQAQLLSFFAIIMVVGRVSGALLNPAVTLAVASRRRLKLPEVLPYLGALSPAPGVPLWQATAVEATATFLLLLVIRATAEDPRAPRGWAPSAIGMALAVSVDLFEPITGAAMNPARVRSGPHLRDALWRERQLARLPRRLRDWSDSRRHSRRLALSRPGGPAQEQTKALVMM